VWQSHSPFPAERSTLRVMNSCVRRAWPPPLDVGRFLPGVRRAAAEQLEATRRRFDLKGLYLARKKVEMTLAPGVVIRISLFCYAVSNRRNLAGMCVVAARSRAPLLGRRNCTPPAPELLRGSGVCLVYLLVHDRRIRIGQENVASVVCLVK